MAKQAAEVYPGLYYDCPVLETGHFSLGEGEYTLRHLRKPARTELKFICAACDEVHVMVLGGEAKE